MQTHIWLPLEDAECGTMRENGQTQLLHHTRQDLQLGSVCLCGAEEVLPEDAPIPLGKPVVMTTSVDANLDHDLVNGRSVTKIQQFFRCFH